MFKVKENSLRICALVLADMNLVIPQDRLREIVESETEWAASLSDYTETATGLDSYDRDYLLWVVAKSVGFEDWPSNSDSEAKAAIFSRALGEAGYIPDYEHIPLDAIAEWIALNWNITPKIWREMVDRAYAQYLIDHPDQPVAKVEQLLAAAFGYR